MDLNEYQREAVKTAVFPAEDGIAYCSLKLCGEAGEHAEKVGKLYFRHDSGELEHMQKDMMDAKVHSIVQELGDVMWYVANLAELYGYTLEEIAQMNLVKLRDRQERGVLKGSGDTR